MKRQVHTLQLALDWKLTNLLSKIDRFDASWSAIERREGQSLKQLKGIATVRSVGASTRIEGSVMSDEEVSVLLENIDISKLEDRDSQEVVGYFEAFDTISESYEKIDVSENSLMHLHKVMLKYSKKDEWHRGDYKQHSNAVEATHAGGRKQIIFQTTAPGFPTRDDMAALIDWYIKDTETPALVKCAIFAYEFVTIHPFQDGNGRLSRLIATLLLLKNGYKWIQYVSFEYEIESRKAEYYRVLMNCQSQRPNEDVTEWLYFFFDALTKIQDQLMQKLEVQGGESQLSIKEKAVLTFIESHPGTKRSEIGEKLGIAIPTLKRLLVELHTKQLIERHGMGAGVHYTVK